MALEERAREWLLGQAQRCLGNAVVDRWFSGVEVIEVRDDVFVLGLPTAFVATGLDSRYRPWLEQAVRRRVDVVVFSTGMAAIDPPPAAATTTDQRSASRAASGGAS